MIVTSKPMIPTTVDLPSLRVLGVDHRVPCRAFQVRLNPTSVPNAGDNLGAGRTRSQLTAFFTSAAIRASSAAVNSFSAKEVGHIVPSSRFAASLKPNVA